MSAPLRIGTRSSPLARTQTRLVVEALGERRPDLATEEVPITTSGDRAPTALRDLDFTDRIDRSLERGEIDLAVHSAKDLPARPSRRVVIGAYLRRADVRDALVLAAPGSMGALRAGARLGSSSTRRRAMLLRWRPDLDVVPIRGNVETRLAAIAAQRLDGAVLACAGLDRLGLTARISERLSIRRMLPAPGQGAIAVAVRSGDRALRRLVGTIDDPATRCAVTAERAALSALGGDCDLPFGALARMQRGRLTLRGSLVSPDGRRAWSLRSVGPPGEATRLGRALGLRLARRRDEIVGGGARGGR